MEEIEEIEENETPTREAGLKSQIKKQSDKAFFLKQKLDASKQKIYSTIRSFALLHG
jgi:hypothetical protein